MVMKLTRESEHIAGVPNKFPLLCLSPHSHAEKVFVVLLSRVMKTDDVLISPYATVFICVTLHQRFLVE